MNGPGARGSNRVKPTSATRTTAENASVGQCTSGSAAARERSWDTIPSPVTWVPVSVPSWPATMISATPVM